MLQQDLPAAARTEERREVLSPNSASHWAIARRSLAPFGQHTVYKTG